VTKDQVFDSLKRVVVMFHFLDEAEKLAYIDSAYEAFYSLDSYKFDQTVKHVMSTWKDKSKPKNGHFREAYNYLAKENGWLLEERRSCEACGGSGFKRCGVTRIQDEGKVHEAVTACPSCRPAWKLKDDVILVELVPRVEKPYYAAAGAPPSLWDEQLPPPPPPTPFSALEPPLGVIDDDLPVEDGVDVPFE